MTLFSAHTHAEAVVLTDRQRIWAALVDPDLVARFTPFLERITADGEHWTWEMGGLRVAGRKVTPVFTEQMGFEEPHRIEFHHDPPAGHRERAGVEGWYDLGPADGGTRLVTDLTITLDLPLPKAAGGAVRAAMGKVVDAMGDRFAKNLLDYLGTQQA